MAGVSVHRAWLGSRRDQAWQTGVQREHGMAHVGVVHCVLSGTQRVSLALLPQRGNTKTQWATRKVALQGWPQ